MDIIGKISNHIGEIIGNEMNHDDDQKEVIKYGVFVGLQIVYSIIACFVVGLVFGMLKEILIVSFSSSILRKYSGGTHASSLNRCVIIGTIAFALMALSMKYILLDLHMKVCVVGIIFIYAYLLIYKRAPVDTGTKRIKNEIKRKKLRNKSLALLCIYAIITIIYINNNISTGITMGVAFQIFTLTKIGHVILSKIDESLSNIIN
ncbi:accessory gene regulator ArgB-like protein [Anaeromicrobium sediminis]|uniref:Accessory regulator AgrB n=1 Tax=Anaeromicrobium sediminis TaxID=1478221 RepID=A0A267MH24_9FIRM|nr:accessory gene regulator B family protein [Anaeromicrobium sediminis]PAB58228.1 hypothetical protein CCE28_16455 [Anaeromicrobium sediminis]